jgi:pimeloyl-ACP methyl ester carboxylesterase
LDRPGFGSSTFQSGRRNLDWAADVDEAADLLRLDRFAVLGVAVGIAPPEAPGMDKAAIARTSRHWDLRPWVTIRVSAR